MSDYISKDALRLIRTKECAGHTIDYAIGWKACVDYLKALPSADVVPVVHGKWMKEDRGHVEYCAVCDQCGFDWMWSDRAYFKFCPNCGADMRGEQE